MCPVTLNVSDKFKRLDRKKLVLYWYGGLAGACCAINHVGCVGQAGTPGGNFYVAFG